MEKTTKIAKRFEGKVAIVTASTQGIGFGIAERLGLEGASVVVSSRKQKNVDEAVEKLKAQGIEVLGVVCHVSSAEQRKNLIDKTVQRYGKVDVVVSNAAANPSIDPILQMQESVLDKLWEINVKSAILILKVYQRREHCKCDGGCSTPRECSYDCSTSRACLNRLPVGLLPPPNLC